MEKDKLDQLSNERLLILVASGAYASHYGFTIEQWLRAKELVRTIPNLIELTKKMQVIPVNISWERIK